MERCGGTNGTVEVGEEGIYMTKSWRVEENGEGLQFMKISALIIAH